MRLGHVSSGTIQKSQPLLDGIGINTCKKIDTFHPCPKGKSTRGPRRPVDDRTTGPLDLVHADLIGPFKVASLGG